MLGAAESAPLGGAKLVAPARVERAQPADALADRRVRGEETREPLLGEGIDREERLRRRAALEGDEVVGLLEAYERVGEPVGGGAERRCESVGRERALRRGK